MRLIDRYFKDLPREVAVLTTVAFCVSLGFGIVAPVIPVFAKSFGVSAFAASSVVSVFALMRLVSAAPGGKLVNRFGERSVLWTGLTIVSLSSLLAGFSQSFEQLIILRGIGGTGSAMFTVSSMSLLLRTVDSAHRGRAASTYQGGFLLGGLAGPAVGGLVVGWSIRAPFFVYSFTLLFAVATAYFALPRGLGRRGEDDSLVEDTSVALTMSDVKHLREYWTTLIVNVVSGMTSFGLRTAIIPIFVIEALGRTAALSSLGFLATSIVQASLLLPAGRLTDTRGRKPAVVIGALSLVAAMTSLVLSESVPSFFVAMVAMGVGAAFLGAGPSAVIGDIVGKRKGGSVVATYQISGDLGTVLGPLLGGFLRDVTGDFFTPFAVGLLFAVGASILAATMPETRKRTEVHAA